LVAQLVAPTVDSIGGPLVMRLVATTGGATGGATGGVKSSILKVGH
jgi:hypothetical protein